MILEIALQVTVTDFREIESMENTFLKQSTTSKGQAVARILRA